MKLFMPPEADDAFFGRMLYMKPGVASSRTGKGFGWWEARRIFLPTGAVIELFIDAPGPELPPNAAQRVFFTRIEKDYKTILKDIEPMLKERFERWTRSPMEKPFGTEFRLASFSIPLPDAEVPWEMSFESESDEHLFTVRMNGDKPESVSVDG